jgi:outer membrane immunogenic protein
LTSVFKTGINDAAMKTFLASTIVIFLGTCFAQSSLAGPERLEAKEMAPAPVAPEPCNWTGFYLGVQGGYGWGDLQWTRPEATPEELIVDQDHNGFFVGGEEGYNLQIGRWFVIGAEGDFSYSEVNGNSGRSEGLSSLNAGASTFETGTDWVGTVGLRAGITFHRFLFFAKGGVAFAHLEYSWFRNDNIDPEEDPHTESFQTDETRAVPMVGGGIEYMINCHWSAKLEYKHLFLEGNHISGSTIENFGEGNVELAEQELYRSRAEQNHIQFGLNYKL